MTSTAAKLDAQLEELRRKQAPKPCRCAQPVLERDADDPVWRCLKCSRPCDRFESKRGDDG